MKVRRPYAFCCIEGGGRVSGCMCSNPDHGFAIVDVKAMLPGDEPVHTHSGEAIGALVAWARSQQAFPDNAAGGSGRGHIDENHRFRLRDMVAAIDAAPPVVGLTSGEGFRWSFNADTRDIEFGSSPVFRVYEESDFPCIEDDERAEAAKWYDAQAQTAVLMLNSLLHDSGDPAPIASPKATATASAREGKLGWDEDGMCDDHYRQGCPECDLTDSGTADTHAGSVTEAAINQNDRMRQELNHIGNLVSDLERTMRVDPANPDGSWPDLAGRITRLKEAALHPVDSRAQGGESNAR